ncbi:ferritin-like domain-containing protein [Flavimarina sp. Hel_I_48]|uniref:ferritin-like domain-containing protein n=1 Tax=Flavimarina sp. Hel_I_48 TaxID=1392488 RepID=UPI0004DF7E01|nr:ferritin-like domain-containing protein [Flavimarina sp. Hel_I_48]
MNFIKLLESLSNREALTKTSSRRDSFQQMKSVGKNVALASIPFGLAATSSKARAATSAMAAAAFQASPTDVLNFALTLEYLEQEFYQKGLNSGVISDADMTVFETISKHEDAHVEFLVNALGADAIAKPTFDFTGGPGGLSLDPFMENGADQETAYAQFMALAQGFEDTGVRAYKGQAGALAVDNTLLDYALQIHSVEARHASKVRRMRMEKGWIVQNNNTLPDAFAPIYAGEENTEQGGVDLAGLFSDFGGADAVTAAFDEPLTMDEVLTIGGFFIVQ